MRRLDAILRLLAVALLAGAHGAALPAVFRIDESGTVVRQAVLPLQWRQLVPRRGSDNTMQGSVRVDVRLNLQPWLNRPAKIFLVFAPVSGTERIRAAWTSQGHLLQGQAVSGERVQVFEGLAQPAILTDSLLLTVEADGESLVQPHTLRFHFEIEVNP